MVAIEGLDRLISEHPFFKDMEPHFQALIAGCATNERFAAGDYLMREGDDANRFYLIRHGSVAIEVHTPGQVSITLETLQENDILGWSWMVPPYRWLFDGRATQLTRVISIDGACLRTKADEDPSLGYELYRRVMPIMSERLNAARMRLLDVYGNPGQKG